MPLLTISLAGQEALTAESAKIRPRKFDVYDGVGKGFMATVRREQGGPKEDFYLELYSNGLKVTDSGLSLRGVALYWHEMYEGFAYGPKKYGFRQPDPDITDTLWVVSFQPPADC